MLNINTNLHFNLYFLHWADTSVLFITLEKNIPTRFWKDTKTQQSWGSGRSVLRIILMRSETWNVVTFELEYPEERKHRVALARNHCNLCVYFTLQRYLLYSSSRHWRVLQLQSGAGTSLEYTILPFLSMPFKSGFFCYSFWPSMRKLHAEHEVKRSRVIVLKTYTLARQEQGGWCSQEQDCSAWIHHPEERVRALLNEGGKRGDIRHGQAFQNVSSTMKGTSTASGCQLQYLQGTCTCFPAKEVWYINPPDYSPQGNCELERQPDGRWAGKTKYSVLSSLCM